MEIAVIGVSYKNADIDIRGSVAFTTSMKENAASVLSLAGISEHVILSTCNRSEIYIASADMSKDIEAVKKYYQSLAGTRILSFLYVKKFDDAIGHIYQVATGLDSLVIGEDEILGQLKEAVAFARKQGSCKKYLDKVIRESITFSKKVRNAYKLTENKLSVASIGIEFLKDKYHYLRDKKVLLIGTGSMGQLILKYLEEEQIESIYLTNRTMNKEKIDFFIDKNVTMIEYPERYDYLNKMDIVISATSSPHTIITKEQCPKLTHNITFLDMAVPRDIDYEMCHEEKAEIITLDDINETVEKHIQIRQEIASQIKLLIAEEVKEVELWILRTKTDSVISGFHKRKSEIVDGRKEQLSGLGLSQKQEKEVLDLIDGCMWQMVKRPVEQLKKLQEKEDLEQYKMIIEELFGFESGDKS